MRFALFAGFLLTIAPTAHAAGIAGLALPVSVGLNGAALSIGGTAGAVPGVAAIGGAVGSSFDLGATVVGSANASTNASTNGGAIGAGGKGCSGGDCVNPNPEAGVLARAGFKIAPKTLVYAVGSYANARSSGLCCGNMGLRVGGGIQQAVNENVYAKVEYRYTSFNSNTVDNGGFGSQSNQASVGVGYRF